MGRVERFSSTGEVAVKQAERIPFIDAGGFQFDLSEAESIGEIGKSLRALGERKRAADDSLAVSQAGELRDLAKAQIDEIIKLEPNPALWGEKLRLVQKELHKNRNKLVFSQGAKAEDDIDQKGFDDLQTSRVETLGVLRTVDNDIFTSGKGLISAIANDDGTPIDLAEIAQRTLSYQAALERKEPGDVADIKMEATLSEALKERVGVLITRKQFKEARDLVNESTAFSGTDALSTLARIDVSERQFESRTIDLGRKQRQAVSEKMMDTLLSGGILTPDEIENSLLLKGKQAFVAEKEINKVQLRAFAKGANAMNADTWQFYTASQVKQMQTGKLIPSRAAGFGKMSEAILDRISGDKTSQEAEWAIGNAAFVDSTISLEDAIWAIGKIREPFPRRVGVDIAAITDATTATLRKTRFFGFNNTLDQGEKAAADTINYNMIRWVDAELDADRTPSRKDMNLIAAQMIASIGRITIRPSDITPPKSRILKQEPPEFEITPPGRQEVVSPVSQLDTEPVEEEEEEEDLSILTTEELLKRITK